MTEDEKTGIMMSHYEYSPFYGWIGDGEPPLHGCLSMALALIMLAILIALLGCSRVQYVEVEKVRTEYVSRVDTVERTDTVMERETVVVREVDSAAMAQYGVQMAGAERAWLVQSERMRKEIERLKESKSDTVYSCDTVAVPYPVEVVKEVARPLAWWKEGLMWCGGLSVLVIGLIVWRRFQPP